MYMNRALLLFLVFFVSQVYGQDSIIPLWPKDCIPNRIASKEVEEHKHNGILRISTVQEPSIEVYLPSKSNATGEAVLIFPGGGYGILAYDWEGTDIAKFLIGKGIAGIVVKYRLPSNISQKNKHEVPLIDAQRAMRLVRSNAARFHLDTKKIGILGFSAGGHLASTLGTQFEAKVYAPLDAVDTESARPDFMALGYPVITFGDKTHKGSKKNLLGENPSQEMVDRYSNEKNVTEHTPSTFLFHASDDTAVPIDNSLLFYSALNDNGVSATLFVYPNGGHGFSLALKDPFLKGWSDQMVQWINNLN
jgi:acetyl esterase/lipase